MAGRVLEIVEIIAPSSAVAGTRVNVTVNIRNIWPLSLRMRVAGVLEEDTILVDYLSWSSPTEVVVGSLQTCSFQGYVTMPNKGVRIRAYGYYYGIDDAWHLDDMLTKDLDLSALAPEFSEFAAAGFSRV